MQFPAKQQAARVLTPAEPETKAPPPRSAFVAAIAPARTKRAAEAPPANQPPPAPPPAQVTPPVEPPPQAAEPVKPNSVFGWGPWDDQPQSSSNEAPTTGGGTSNPGVAPRINVVANSGANGSGAGNGGGGGGSPMTQPPVVTPPPTMPNTRPGFGLGDKNHVHTKGR